MAITNFIPEIWSANILVELQKSLVFGALANRDYEGDIANAGDTVHVTGIQDITVGDYTAHTDIAIEAASDKDAGTLVIDQAKYFAFEVDDLEKRQALGGLQAQFTSNAAYQLADVADQYVAGLMAAAAGSTVPAVTTTTDKPTDAYNTLVKLRTALDKKNVPTTGRWVVISPDVYAQLLLDNRFISATEAAHDTLLNGLVGSAAGFQIHVSNNTPYDAKTKAYTLLAGTNAATTFAQQIASVEAARMQNRFADMVKGLHLYGGKVFQPAQLTKVSYTLTEA